MHLEYVRYKALPILTNRQPNNEACQGMGDPDALLQGDGMGSHTVGPVSSSQHAPCVDLPVADHATTLTTQVEHVTKPMNHLMRDSSAFRSATPDKSDDRLVQVAVTTRGSL